MLTKVIGVKSLILLLSYVGILGLMSGAMAQGPLAGAKGRTDTTWIPGAAPLRVMTALPPVADLLEDVGGGLVEVHTLLGVGDNPHTFSLRARQLQEFKTVQVYFFLGLGFEEVLLEKLRANFVNLKVVDLRKGLTLRRVGADEGAEHHHDEEGACCQHESAGGFDPHVWLDPINCLRMAGNASEVFKAFLPAHKEGLEEAFGALEKRAVALHHKIQEKANGAENRGFFVYHAAFGYFAEAYKLQQHVLEVDGKPPSARHLQEFARKAREAGARRIFIQPQFNPRPAEILAEAIGGQVAMLDPLGKDWEKNIIDLAAAAFED
jgi:zinc transport system substrate-binding protein